MRKSQTLNANRCEHYWSDIKQNKIMVEIKAGQ